MIRSRTLGIDRWLLGAVLALCGFGLVMVFSASEVLGNVLHGNPEYFFFHQIIWLALGTVFGLLALGLDYHRLRGWAPALAAGTALALLLVLVPHIGVSLNGARRWIGIGPLTVQPAELAKITGIVYLARWLEKSGPRLRTVREGLFPFLLMVGALVGMVLLEKDLGTAMVLALIAISMFLVAGARPLHLLATAGLSGVLLWVLVVIEPYRAHRMLSFMNPWTDSLNTGFQSVQSALALGTGGIWGVGLGNSVQKYQWLPAAHTDFIFAIIGEELGLIGTLAVLAAFCFLAFRGYRAALRAPDTFGLLLATGITSWLTFEAFINMAAVTLTLPTTGIPLPFVSFGGSALSVALGAVGLLLNISAQGVRPTVHRRAGVDIGRRHRGAHIPSAVRRTRPD
ncbi:MAG TPA: putative lipid II flippase FtsW [Candidatus Dormibacteraeota bacterium]|jgi:cell division protein FtsW|nr:putative lipid II flippase FtsW [Candidatus Dormibacteraeota bacterium]